MKSLLMVERDHPFGSGLKELPIINGVG